MVERTADHERIVYIAVSLEFTFLRAKRPQRRWLQGNRRVCMGNKVFETLDEINELKAIKVINKV